MAKPKLNQIVAVVAGKKSDTQKKVTELYHQLQKPDLFDGMSRSYRPKDGDGEQLPTEHKNVRVKSSEVIGTATAAWEELWNAVAAQDVGNCQATASVRFDCDNGLVVLPPMPATHLLFMEKQLNDVRAFIEKLPTLDSSEVWHFDDKNGMYATDPMEQVRTKKTPRVLVKAPATDKHPAQVDVFHEDVPVGVYNTIKYSGAVSSQQKNTMLERARHLQEAVKKAREEANLLEVDKQHNARAWLDLIFK